MTEREEILARTKVLERIGTDEVLAQLAEEASELAQAALKARRALEGSKNPTPVALGEALENLTEEMSDVLLCESMLGCLADFDYGLMQKKLERRVQRLEGKEDGRQGKHGAG